MFFNSIYLAFETALRFGYSPIGSMDGLAINSINLSPDEFIQSLPSIRTVFKRIEQGRKKTKIEGGDWDLGVRPAEGSRSRQRITLCQRGTVSIYRQYKLKDKDNWIETKNSPVP